MNKLEYLAALKTALAGLAPEIVTDMLHAYEMRFIEGASLGRSEQEIILNLDTPQTVAKRLKGNLDPPHQYTPPLKNTHTTDNIAWGRKLFAIVGLGMFNLFMLIPTMVFCSLLFASFISSMAFLVSGSAITAASLANVNQITLNSPKTGNPNNPNNPNTRSPGVVKITKDGIAVENPDKIDDANISTRPFKWIHFGKLLEPSTPVGIGLILASILLMLLNLVIVNYSFIGLKRYLAMNYSLIKNA